MTLNNTEENGASQEGAAHFFNQLINDILLPLVCVFGILGVILTLIVLSKKPVKEATNVYFVSLAVVDLLFLLIISTHIVENLITSDSEGPMIEILFIYQTYTTILLHILLLTSTYITIAMGFQRMLAITYPLHNFSRSSQKKSKKIVFLVFVVAVMLRLPEFFEYSIKIRKSFKGQQSEWHNDTSEDPSLGEHAASNESHQTPSDEVIIFEPSRLLKCRAYVLSYGWLVDGVVQLILPILFLIIINICLIIEVRKSSQFLRENADQCTKLRQLVIRGKIHLTSLLVANIGIFLVCETPYIIHLTLFSLLESSGSPLEGTSPTLFKDIALLLISLKTSFTLTIYCICNTQFRVIFCRLICCGTCCQKDTQFGEVIQLETRLTTPGSRQRNGGIQAEAEHFVERERHATLPINYVFRRNEKTSSECADSFA